MAATLQGTAERVVVSKSSYSKQAFAGL